VDAEALKLICESRPSYLRALLRETGGGRYRLFCPLGGETRRSELAGLGTPVIYRRLNKYRRSRALPSTARLSRSMADFSRYDQALS
jgi:hypothetical protein